MILLSTPLDHQPTPHFNDECKVGLGCARWGGGSMSRKCTQCTPVYTLARTHSRLSQRYASPGHVQEMMERICMDEIDWHTTRGDFIGTHGGVIETQEAGVFVLGV
ncbi:hypothetical protein NPIL_23771 [Nephila pilipes]|uniref:Uncharacterized protein n=1 Tax=Nephila pilipes TaxID=299642 RepID=A0A8X6INA7_NEPPI|nr:hypothetical protein NPIL_23771 [Nephila pilipes]